MKIKKDTGMKLFTGLLVASFVAILACAQPAQPIQQMHRVAPPPLPTNRPPETSRYLTPT